MIDREFIEKIEDMTGPKVIETVQGTFSDKHLYRIENELADTIVLSSLSGLAEMICNVKDLLLPKQNLSVSILTSI